jgi:SAM-dependent methyltransferase
MGHTSYETEGLDGRVGAVLSQLPAELTPTSLAALDQFHAGGAEPVERLLSLGGVGPDMVVVDLGSGLGGPARLAATRGAKVIGVDQTAPFVALANELTRRCGLADRVAFQVGDMTAPALLAGSADRVLLIHAQMNVVDKPALMRTVARLLRPGGALLAWEICAADAADVSWPVPWSLDGTDSHLATQSELRAAMEGAGLRVTAWEDRTAWVQQWFQRALAAPPPSGPSLFSVLDRGPERARNFAQALRAKQLNLVEVIANA